MSNEQDPIDALRALQVKNKVGKDCDATIDAAVAEIRRLRAMVEDESRHALLYMTALVVKAGGSVVLQPDELRSAASYVLERADPDDDSLHLRAYTPTLETARIVTPHKHRQIKIAEAVGLLGKPGG